LACNVSIFYANGERANLQTSRRASDIWIRPKLKKLINVFTSDKNSQSSLRDRDWTQKRPMAAWMLLQVCANSYKRRSRYIDIGSEHKRNTAQEQHFNSRNARRNLLQFPRINPFRNEMN
jgi:hypothetical protein